MGKAKAGHILIFISKFSNRSNCIYKLLFNKKQRFTHCNNIRVITDIAACCTKMNNSLCVRALLTISMNMAHNIVAEFFFIFLCNLIVNIISMSLKLFYLFLCNIKSKLIFSFSKGNPKPSPCLKLKIGRINILHFLAGVTSIERRIISIIRHYFSRPVLFIISA